MFPKFLHAAAGNAGHGGISVYIQQACTKFLVTLHPKYLKTTKPQSVKGAFLRMLTFFAIKKIYIFFDISFLNNKVNCLILLDATGSNIDNEGYSSLLFYQKRDAGTFFNKKIGGLRIFLYLCHLFLRLLMTT